MAVMDDLVQRLEDEALKSARMSSADERCELFTEASARITALEAYVRSQMGKHPIASLAYQDAAAVLMGYGK